MSNRQKIKDMLKILQKEAYVPPIDPNAGAMPMDPSMGGMPPPMPPMPPMDPSMGGMPMDPAAMGGAIDPMTGMPMDPAAMGGMPMDPSMGMDPAAMGGMPMDPSMGGAIDPMTGMPMDPNMGMEEDLPPLEGEGETVMLNMEDLRAILQEAVTGKPAEGGESSNAIEDRLAELEEKVNQLTSGEDQSMFTPEADEAIANPTAAAEPAPMDPSMGMDPAAMGGMPPPMPPMDPSMGGMPKMASSRERAEAQLKKENNKNKRLFNNIKRLRQAK